jgi:hypothetical protein
LTSALPAETVSTALRVHVSDPRLVDDLLDFIERRLDSVQERVAIDEVEISPLGSYGEEAAGLALDLQLRAWEAAHPGVRAVRRERV